MKLIELAEELNVSAEAIKQFIQDFDLDLIDCISTQFEVKEDFEKFARENVDFLKLYEKDLDENKTVEQIAETINQPKEKIEKAEKDLQLIRESFINDQNNGTDDTSPTFKAFEEGAETLSKEQNSILAGRQEKFVRDLKNALIRIENKTYGVCRVTGKLIPKERLLAVPHATLSIEAKNMQK